MRVPVVVAVNMMDVARQRQMRVVLEVLERELGCPVVSLEAHRGKGIKELKQAVMGLRQSEVPSGKGVIYSGALEDAILQVTKEMDVSKNNNATWIATRLLEEDKYAEGLVSEKLLSLVVELKNQIRTNLNEDADILLADARYRFIHELVTCCVEKTGESRRTWTSRIDNIVLNRMLGIPIFLGVMYCMFLFAINMGGAFQDFFDIGSNTIFVDGLAHVLMGGARRIG